MKGHLLVLFLSWVLFSALVLGSDLPSVCLCLVTRDEMEDLGEWIAYHHSLGVSHVIIFENNSENSSLSDPDIMKWARSGFIKSYNYFMENSEPNNQLYAYKTCLKQFGHQFDFMGFIDTDEFVVIKDRNSTLPQVLEPYKSFGGLVVNSMFLGSNGHISRPTGGVLSNYNKCVYSNLVKSFVVPKHTQDTGPTPHAFKYNQGFFAVDVAKKFVDSAWNPRGNGLSMYGRSVGDHLFEKIFINHYIVKSLADYKRKMRRGSGDGAARGLHFFHEMNSLAVNNCSYLELPRSPNPELFFDRRSGGWVQVDRDPVHHQITGMHTPEGSR